MCLPSAALPTSGSGRIGEAAYVADVGPAIWRHRSLGKAVIGRARPCHLLAAQDTRGTHSDPPAYFGDRCRFLLRPVTPAASGVLAVADPGLPVGSQTDIPCWCIDDRMRRGGRAGGGWREPLLWSWPLSPSLYPASAAHSGNVARVHPVLPASAAGRVVQRTPGGCAPRMPPPATRQGKPRSCRRQSGALDSEFTSVSEPRRHGALTAMPPPRRHVRHPAPVRVDRIATTPMSRPQHEQAVAALAVLITAWQHGPTAKPGEDRASPVPLPGPGEQH